MQLKTFFRAAENQAELATAKQDSYENWRDASDAVAESYRSWVAAARGERWLAYAAYMAALECEERSAQAYQLLAERAPGA